MNGLPALIPVTGRRDGEDGEQEPVPGPGECAWSWALEAEGWCLRGHGETPLVIIRGMCEHEHDVTIRLCAACAEYLQELHEDRLAWCRACYYLPEELLHLCSPGPLHQEPATDKATWSMALSGDATTTGEPRT